MTHKFVVGFDGSDASKKAVHFAVNTAKMTGAHLLIIYVLEWSPYSFLTPEEIEERHKRREEEMARAEKAILSPLKEELFATGVQIETGIRFGNVADILCTLAKQENAEQIFIGRTGDSDFASRVFGSVAGKLALSSPVACTIVP